MGLLDFDLNKLKSFDYKKVGQKQGEYFGEDNATGFTPNRQAGDTTEYISNSTTKLGLDGINFPGPVNYFQDDNATGFTIGRQPGDETEYNTESSIYREGFPGPVDFFLNTNATGYTLNRNEGDPTEYILDPNSSIYKQGFPGPVDYFLNTNANGFTIGRKEKDPTEFVNDGTTGKFDDGLGNNEGSSQIVVNQGYAGSEPLGLGQTFTTPRGDVVSGKKIVGYGDESNDVDSQELIPLKPGQTLEDQYNKFGGNKALRRSGKFNSDVFNNEPFIIRDIGDEYDGIELDEGLTRGGILLNTQRGLEDKDRILKFLGSPRGLRFLAKQTILQKGNSFWFTRGYNELSMFSSPPGLNSSELTNITSIVRDITSTRHNPIGLTSRLKYEDTSLETDLPDIATEIQGTGKTDEDNKEINNAFSRFVSGVTSGVSEFASNLSSEAKLFINEGQKALDKAKGKTNLSVEVTHGRDLQVPYGGKFGDLKTEKLPKDFVKFRIRDAVNGKWIIFPAFLEDISDSSTAEYSQERYIGRPDAVHIYTGYSRNISFNFKVVAMRRNEIPIIWEKLNYLKGLTTPTFRKVFEGDTEFRPISPYIYLTIGDMFNNTPGYFSSVNINTPATTTWEISDGVQYPQVADVALEFVYIGKTLPNSLGKHYEIPWLTDDGVGAGNFSTFGENDPTDENNLTPTRGKYEIDGKNLDFDKTIGSSVSNIYKDA